MKKDYIKPLAFAVKIESVSMMATSISINPGGNPSDAGSSLSNRDRGEWGNLWN